MKFNPKNFIEWQVWDFTYRGRITAINLAANVAIVIDQNETQWLVDLGEARLVESEG